MRFRSETCLKLTKNCSLHKIELRRKKARLAHDASQRKKVVHEIIYRRSKTLLINPLIQNSPKWRATTNNTTQKRNLVSQGPPDESSSKDFIHISSNEIKMQLRK